MDAKTKDRLAEALAFRKMKPIELSRLSGLHRGLISQWLSGRMVPKQDKIFILSKALGVSASWLMGLDVPMIDAHVTINNKGTMTGTVVNGNINNEYSSIEGEGDVWQMYQALSEEAKKRIDRIIKGEHEDAYNK